MHTQDIQKSKYVNYNKHSKYQIESTEQNNHHVEFQQIHVSEQERSFTMDLKLFMNPAPYTVPLV